MKSDKKISVIFLIVGLVALSGLALAQTEDDGGVRGMPGLENLRRGIPSRTPSEPPISEIAPEEEVAPEAEVTPGAEPAVPEGPVVRTDLEGPLTDEEKVYLNVQEADIKDVIKQISKATSRNFIIDDKIRGKITIISERPMTREEAYQTFLSALEVAGYTTVKGPANVIKIVPLKDAKQSPIPIHVDTTPYTDSFVTRLIPLENISALEMSSAIKDLISRDGNLFAYPATNTLIITDSGSNIDRLMKIVKELDQEGPQQVMEIIPVRNAMASDVAKMVQDLFEKEKAARATRARKGATQLEELDEVSKIIADERTNSIIVMASKRAIENVRAIIKKLDSRLSADQEGKIHVYYLKHANAKEMAETLSSLTSAAGAKTSSTKGADIAVAKFEGGMKITADEGTNALIITALAKDFQTLIDKVISKLDIPRRQVYFEAVVMEMTLTKGTEYGVAGYGGAGAGSTIGFGQTLGGPSLMGSILAGAATGGTSAWPAFLGGLVSSRTTDITYVGADGTSSTLTVPAFSAFLSALATRGEANIVSMPNLLTLDNEEATMHVLSKEPTPGSTTFGAQGIATTQSVDYKEAGLELKIKPQITEGDMVKMEIEQKLSGFTAATYDTSSNAPAIKERKVKTTVVTENGQTVVLAGLMDDASSKHKRKIPLLGDIPILGILFSTTQTSMAKNNLLIFITPHIIKDRTDFSEILKRKIEERNRFIDQNYSKSKRRQIRDTIKTHREDLLEFSPQAAGKFDVPATPEITYPEVKAVPQRPVYTPLPTATPTYAPGRQPVITIPQAGTTMRGKTIPTTPMTYQPPPTPSVPIQQPVPPAVQGEPLESSTWRPVTPRTSASKSLPTPTVRQYEPQPLPVTKPEKTVKTELKKKKKETAMVHEAAPWLPQPEKKPSVYLEPKPVEEYKKPVVPTEAFDRKENGDTSARISTIPPPATVKETVRIETRKVVPEAAAPVVTVPDDVKKKEWKKPQPGGVKELDLNY